MKYENVIFEIEGSIATVTLNQPSVLNSLTYKMIEEILDAIGRLAEDDEVRAVIITGYGSKLFPYWDMGPPYDGPAFSEEFTAGLPENMRTLFLGRPHWGRSARYRQFSDPADLRKFDLGVWNERD